ncbi:MAG: hypothetical protein WAW52_06900, partial [Methanothrix sp.]
CLGRRGSFAAEIRGSEERTWSGLRPGEGRRYRRLPEGLGHRGKGAGSWWLSQKGISKKRFNVYVMMC